MATAHLMNGHTHHLMNGTLNPHMAMNGYPIDQKVEADQQNIDDENATNLIINYLPQEMTEEELRTLFSSIGPLESCKLIRDKVTRASLGYAFVKYERTNDAKKAIESLQGMKLTNKTIKVSVARPSSNEIKNANLYVSGLPLTVTEHELRVLFARYGPIITSKVLYDESSQSRGVGFVRYDKRADAEAAINGLNNRIPELNGAIKPLTVKFANPPSQKIQPYLDILTQAKGLAGSAFLRQAVGLSQLSPMSSTGASLSTSPIASPLSPNSASLLRNNMVVNQAPSASTLNGIQNSSWCVFVYNLPSDAIELTLFQLFSKFGAIQSTRVVYDENTKKCKGFGFVNMAHYEDATMAILHLNGYCCERGKPLQVSFKRPKSQGNLSMA
uniref:ELAV n=1 Tax=Hydractinia echinata TaxID=3283270 RepID=S5LXY9_HYDEC|nr:ELAV [Hydractinia echinata]